MNKKLLSALSIALCLAIVFCGNAFAADLSENIAVPPGSLLIESKNVQTGEITSHVFTPDADSRSGYCSAPPIAPLPSSITPYYDDGEWTEKETYDPRVCK